MSQQGTQIATSPQKSPLAINIANFLRENAILKRRAGLLNNKDEVDFFRYKRLIRALLSDSYKDKQKNPKNELIPIPNETEAQKVFVQLIQSQFIVPVDKLHYHEIRQNKGWKPNRTKPTLKISQKATLDPDAYFAWTYNKPNPYILLYSVLTLVGVFAVILFPLWPLFMKVGVWYASMGMLGLVGLFFLTAIVRLIIYVVTLLALPQAFWLYPNLFADCGVIESFQPFYAWEEPKKSKKGKKAAAGAPEAVKPVASSSGVKTSSGATKRKVVLEEVAE